MTADELCPDEAPYTVGARLLDMSKTIRLDERQVRRIVRAHQRDPQRFDEPQRIIRRLEHMARLGRDWRDLLDQTYPL